MKRKAWSRVVWLISGCFALLAHPLFAVTATLQFINPSAPISFNFSFPGNLLGSTDVTFNQLTNFNYTVSAGTFGPGSLTYNDNIFDFNTVTKTFGNFTLVSQAGTFGFNLTTASSAYAFLPSGGASTTVFFTGYAVVFNSIGQTPGLTPNQRSTGTNIDNYNGPLDPTTFGAVVTALANVPAAQIGAALDQLSPLQFSRFTSETAFNNASFETQEMDSYLASQRGGDGDFLTTDGGIDTTGLVINDPSYDAALAMVHSRLMAWNPAPLQDGAISDVADQLLGGTDMKEMKSMAPSYNDPWNFFIRGNVVLAQGFSDPDVSHFDDNTESVVLGTDYRINPNWLVGLTAGYAHTDATFDDWGSSATVDSYSPGFYVSYADQGWYADLIGDYVHNAYTQSRVIGLIGQTANSAPEGNEGMVDMDGGYDFHQGAFTFGPLAGLQYTHLSVDGYNETGSVADLSVAGSQSDSLRSRLGGRVSYAFSHFGINFTPHLEASWQHEFLDQSRGISSQFNTAGLGSFSVRTANPSRDSAIIDFGLDADIDRTWTLFADYIAQAGQENYFGQSVQAGVKITF